MKARPYIGRILMKSVFRYFQGSGNMALMLPILILRGAPRDWPCRRHTRTSRPRSAGGRSLPGLSVRRLGGTMVLLGVVLRPYYGISAGRSRCAGSSRIRLHRTLGGTRSRNRCPQPGSVARSLHSESGNSSFASDSRTGYRLPRDPARSPAPCPPGICMRADDGHVAGTAEKCDGEQRGEQKSGHFLWHGPLSGRFAGGGSLSVQFIQSAGQRQFLSLHR